VVSRSSIEAEYSSLAAATADIVDTNSSQGTLVPIYTSM